MFVSSNQSSSAANVLARLMSRFWLRFEPPRQQHDQLRSALSEIDTPACAQMNAQF